MAGGGPSTRLVSAVNTISAGHQHICGEGLFFPVVIIYGMPRLTCTAEVRQAALMFVGVRLLQIYNAGICRI